MADLMPIALSTCWCSGHHTGGYAMLREMADLGFDKVELSHGIRASLLPGILQAMGEGWIRVTSVHNFCPLPPGILHAAPNLFEPTARSRRERERWRRYTIQTLDLAQKLEAGRIVLHGGSIRRPWWQPGSDPSKRLEKLASREARYPDRAESCRESRKKALACLEREARPFRKTLGEALASVVPEARQRGIRLGLENREAPCELPLDGDFEALLEAADPEGQTLGLWHDTGHSRLKARLGLAAPDALLPITGTRLTGWHLHDVSDAGRDHQTPGSGTVDWNRIAPYLRPESVPVIELSPRRSPGEVVRARDFILSLMSRPRTPRVRRR